MSLGHRGLINHILGKGCQERQLVSATVFGIVGENRGWNQIHAFTLGINISTGIVEQDGVTINSGIEVIILVTDKANRQHRAVRLRQQDRSTMSRIGNCGKTHHGCQK